MNTVERYIEDVMASVFAAPEDRQRLEADLRAHFGAAEEAGDDPLTAIAAMGTAASVAAAFNAEREIDYAGFWRRLVAFLGDSGVFLALAVVPVGVAVFAEASAAPDGDVPLLAGILIGLFIFALVGALIFYFPLLEARFGKTLGKHLMRIRVVRETGAPIGLGQAFVRRLSLYFELLVVDSLFIPFTDKKQRALDIIAKTVVAREPVEEAPLWSWAVCLLLPVVSLCAMAALTALAALGSS